MSSREKLGDADTPPEELDRVVGAFVQSREEEALKKRWASQVSGADATRRVSTGNGGGGLPRRATFIALSVAAAILLFVLVLPFFSVASGSTILAEARAEVELITTRSADLTDVSALRNALVGAVNADDDARIIRAADALAANVDINDRDRLNLAKAYLKADRADAALSLLAVLRETRRTYRTEVTYFTGLSLLSSGRITAGLDTLDALPKIGSGRYYPRARQLIGASWE